MDDARRAAERAARVSYGRLLALVAARSHDVAAAQDALADAFAAALSTWPELGVPDRPDAWLLVTARRAAGRQRRLLATRDRAAEAIRWLHEESSDRFAILPDRRLELLFVCAHPAIDPLIRTPLMLQTVLGIDAARIAAAFLVRPSAMSQRLVRAKAKIRDSGIAFETPTLDDLAPRLQDVLEAIYAAYGTGWDALAGADEGVRGLTEEAIFLGRLVVSLLPTEPEAKGLLAVMLYCEARIAARRNPDGRFVPLDRQDPARWSKPMIGEAESLLRTAARSQSLGRFQVEAAIQSIHVQQPPPSSPARAALVTLYELLATLTPSLGVRVARAAARAGAGDPGAALAELDALQTLRVASYQPYWVTRARVLNDLGRPSSVELERAIGLTEDSAVRAFLRASASRT